MQLILVVIVIFFPQTVTVFLDKEVTLDISQAERQLEQLGSGRSEKPPATMD